MKFLQTLKNLGKIKEYVVVLLVIVTKTKNILTLLENELNDIPVGDKVKEYLPKVKEALETAETAITKVLGFFGIKTSSASALSQTVEQEAKELEDALRKIKSL